jgi:hypothetical protein
MIFNRHDFVKKTVEVGFKNPIKTISYKSVKQFNYLQPIDFKRSFKLWSLPLNRRWRLTRHVISYARNDFDLINNSVRHLFK